MVHWSLKCFFFFFLLHFQSRIVSHIFGGFYPACSICCLHHTFGPPSHPSIEKSYLFLWYSNLVAFTAIPFYLVGEIIYNLYSVGHFSLPNIQKSETILKNTPKNYCKTIYWFLKKTSRIYSQKLTLTNSKWNFYNKAKTNLDQLHFVCNFVYVRLPKLPWHLCSYTYPIATLEQYLKYSIIEIGLLSNVISILV